MHSDSPAASSVNFFSVGSEEEEAPSRSQFMRRMRAARKKKKKQKRQRQRDKGRSLEAGEEDIQIVEIVKEGEKEEEKEEEDVTGRSLNAREEEEEVEDLTGRVPSAREEEEETTSLLRGGQRISQAQVHLFQNQLELATGQECLLVVPSLFLPEPKWHMVCPKMRDTKPKTGDWAYFDGYDLYPSMEAVADTSFADQLVQKPNAVYESCINDPPVFSKRQVFG